jgi:hypothetical protein
MAAQGKTAVWERISTTAAFVSVGRGHLVRFDATSAATFDTELRKFCARLGATKLVQARVHRTTDF